MIESSEYCVIPTCSGLTFDPCDTCLHGPCTSILNVMMDAHSLSCMLHTGHLASEVRPHSWLSNGGKIAEGSSAIPQDAAVDILAILKGLCLHCVDCSNVWLAWSRLQHISILFSRL